MRGVSGLLDLDRKWSVTGDCAEEGKWAVVRMKTDWKIIFPSEQDRAPAAPGGPAAVNP